MRFSHPPDIEIASKLLKQLVGTESTCEPREVDKPLVLYGAGDLGRMAKNYFDFIGIPIKFIVDANAAQRSSELVWSGINIVDPNDVDPNDRSKFLLAVCIVKTQFTILLEELTSQGWNDVVPFYDIAEAYRDRHPLGNGWFSGQLDPIDTSNIEQVLATWSDNTSRAHHLQFIAWHKLREDWLFDNAEITVDDRYFTPHILSILSSDEVFIDLGSHRGETIHRFIGLTNSRFKKIFAIEPDTENLAHLRARLESLGPKIQNKINVIRSAVAEQVGREIFFTGLGYASQLCELGQQTIDVLTIDQMQISPSFVKLHLEGGELAALKGSLHTLTKNRPIIVATIYHNRQGLWESAKWMMKNLVNYVFMLRLHSWCGTGAVMYAVPRERKVNPNF